MDPIQAGIVELEKQRKMSAFNARVFCAALRESNIHFRTIRKLDIVRGDSLADVLCSALAEQPPESRSPDHWVQKSADHVASLATTSKFYAAMMGLMGVVTAYFLGNSVWWWSVATGLILVALTKAKWGLDKYCAGLERIRNALQNISEQSIYELISTETALENVQQGAAPDCHSATLHGGR